MDLPTSKCICRGVLCFWLVLYTITGNIYGCIANYWYPLFNNELSDSVPAVGSRLPWNDLPKSLFNDQESLYMTGISAHNRCHNETNDVTMRQMGYKE